MLNQDIFKNPPAEYRPMPFWFWNSKMRKPEIEAQIRDFASKGLGGFFIHARFGLETEYLSRDWMDCVKYAVEIARELGLEVWLYDENGFPSGIGDLKVSRIPEYRPQFIDLTEAHAGSEESVEIELPHGEVLFAYAHPAGKPAFEKIDLAGNIVGDVLRWKASGGEWQIAVYSKCVLEDPNDVVFGVNYLSSEAMRYFFDLTLEPYESALGEHFGKTIKGIFTDEPTLLPWHHNICWYGQRRHGRVVVWDQGIEREMMARMEIGAKVFLPHLFFDIDNSSSEIRRAFWQVVSELYVRAFFEPYSKWCEEHGLKLTGHVLFEEGLYLNTNFQADITEPLRRMHIPGTDHLAEVTETPYGGHDNLPQQLTNLQGEKLVSSIGHLCGRDTVISETYGCAGWGLSFEKMKWIADWQFSLGINMLCPHAMFYSIEGFRKSDAPPAENFMTGWEHYKMFADYIGRISYMLRSGTHAAKVALLYPLRRFWEAHLIGEIDEDDKALSDSFDLCASLLTRLHWDYDILPEQMLAQAEAVNGRIRIHDEDYEVLIAPPFALQGASRKVMQEFLRSGGTWVLPPVSKGEPERQQIEREIALVRHSMGDEAAERMHAEIERQWPLRPRHIVLERGNEGVVILTLAGTEDHEGVMRALEGALREASTPDVEITSESGETLYDMRYLHREDDARHIYFVINTSDKPARAMISLETAGAVQEWNPQTGDVSRAGNVELRDGRVRVRFDMPAYGSTVYVVDTDRPVQSRPFTEKKREELMVFPDEWEFRIHAPNALILDRWEFHPRTHGFGSEYEYTASFDCDYVPADIALMLDDIEYRSSLMGGMDIIIEVNNTKWERPEFSWYIEKGFKTLGIGEAVLQGKNMVRIVIRHSAWSGQPHLINAPPVLLGSFTCDRKDRTLLAPVTKVSAGSWTEFGYLFYSGKATYSQAFMMPKTDGRRIIVAADDVRDMVEIEINGKTADVRLWQPWEADITDLLVEGKNTLMLTVTNSMVNFLEGSARESGLMSRVRLFAED